MKELHTDEQIAEIRLRLLRWGVENYRAFPWRSPDRPWHGLIAEILLQRTRAQNVSPVYREFVIRFPTPDALASTSTDEIATLINPLGLRWRASILRALGEQIIEIGSIPECYEELILLPGVGPYVAAAWLSFHCGVRSVIVDANVVRWICRIINRKYGAETRRQRWLVECADRMTPSTAFREYNYALLDFTATMCSSRRPLCQTCPIGASLCLFGKNFLKNGPETIDTPGEPSEPV